MKQPLIILIFILLIQLTSCTSVPPPSVRYKIVNNTKDTIHSLIQIQSDFEDFAMYDTFALENLISNNELHLSMDRTDTLKEYQKLIIITGVQTYETDVFAIVSNWWRFRSNSATLFG